MAAFPHPAYARHVLAPNMEQAKAYLVPAMLAASRAHCLMLVRQGLLAVETGRRLLRGLDLLQAEGVAGVEYDGRFEDLFFYLEHRLGALAGDDAVGQLQVARSRNDLDATMCRWVVRDGVLTALAQLHALRRLLLSQAEEHLHTIMPGYTHGQPAQPTTLAHYLAAVTAFLERDSARLQAAYGRTNRCPLGAVAFTGTGFPIDRDYVAGLLGFAGPVESTYDAVGGADYQAEVAAVVQVAAAGLSRLVTDLAFWATREAGALHIGDDLVQISSIMPQKRNPVVLEHLRTQLGYLYADAQCVLTLHHNSPLGDANDVEDPLYRPLFRLLGYAAGVYELLAAVMAGATWDVARLEVRAGEGLITATELADTLVRKAGLPFRAAHRVVVRVMRDAQVRGLASAQITAALVDEAAQAVVGRLLNLPEAEVQQALDVRHFVELRALPGGPAPAATRAVLCAQRGRLEVDEAWRDAELTRLAEARRQLAEEVACLLG